jgi:uncharacterized protein YqhQ
MNLFEKVDDKISEIPFLRSLTSFYKEKYLILLLILSVIHALNKSNYHFLFIIYLLPLLIAIIYIKFTEAGKYHSAEHMVINAYENGGNLSIENVFKQPRSHLLCGTNPEIVLSLFFLLGFTFKVPFVLTLVLGVSLREEIITLLDKRRGSLFGKGINKIQIILFTSKPEEKHLLLAIKTLDKLLKLENG